MSKAVSFWWLLIAKSNIDGVRDEHFRFGSVFCPKSNQTDFFLKKKTNRTESIQNRPLSVRFGPVFLVKKFIKPNFVFGPSGGPSDGPSDGPSGGFSNKIFDGLFSYKNPKYF